MQDLIFNWIYGFFDAFIAQPLHGLGIALGPGDWFFIIYTVLFVAIIAFLARRVRSIGKKVPEGVTRVVASIGDVSGGIAGARKLKFIKSPSDALVFLKIEENAVQQALSAVDYYTQQGELDESMKSKIVEVYKARLEVVRAAIAKDEELKEAIDTSSAVDKARSDYLRKLAAMSGTTVEADTEAAGPTSVGVPGTARSAGSRPVSAAPAGPPAGGPPSGGPPAGGPPSGGPPSGGPPAGGPPSGGPPSGGPPSGSPSAGGPPVAGAAPSGVPSAGGPPGIGPSSASSGPQGSLLQSSGPSASPGARPAGVAGGKSSLQSEMLAEMERLRALMGGD